MGHTPYRLEHLHTLVRSPQGLVLPHGELQVPLPYFGVTLLGPYAHLLQRARKLRNEVRCRGKRVAPRVRRPVQRTIRVPDVELGLVGGERPVSSLREPPQYPLEGATRATLPGRARVGLRHVAGDHRLPAGEG